MTVVFARQDGFPIARTSEVDKDDDEDDGEDKQSPIATRTQHGCKIFEICSNICKIVNFRFKWRERGEIV